MSGRAWKELNQLHFFMAIIGLALLGPATSAPAQEDRARLADRLERLERRFNEMAERQEQFIRRLGAQMEQHRRPVPFAEEHLRHPMPPLPAPGIPGANPQYSRTAKLVKSLSGMLGLLFLIGIICNILLAIWIFTDIRKRGEGSGVFLAMALVAGIPAAIIHALARISDRKL